jgi:hypothetical protein
MLMSSRQSVTILGITGSGWEEDIIALLVVFMRFSFVASATTYHAHNVYESMFCNRVDLILGGALWDPRLNFQWENPRWLWLVVPGSSGSLVVFLSKALFGDWTFSKIKTQDLSKVWRRFFEVEVEVSSPLMLLVYSYLPGDIILEKIFRSRGVITTDVAILMQSQINSARFFVFFSSSFAFWLCGSLMCRLALIIMLLQRLEMELNFFWD